MTKMRGLKRLCASLVVCLTGAVSAPVSAADTLRVCADPKNLPFSKSAGKVRGLYVDLAELVGQRLNMEVEYVWWLTFYTRRALRNTILKNECDVIFALPASKQYKVRGLKRTKPFMTFSYALVSPPDVEFSGLSDLKPLRLGVQFQTNPHILMSMREGFNTRTYTSSDALLQGLSDSEIDAGFLWGPIAGFDNHQQYDGRWKVTPLSGADWEGDVAIGVRAEKVSLLERIDAALVELKPEIERLAREYHIPQGPAVKFDGFAVTPSAAAEGTPAETSAMKAQVKVEAKTGTKPEPTSASPAVSAVAMKKEVAASTASPEELIKAGRVRFNDICSHCHSVDGASPVPARDLRRLRKRYDTEWPATARHTILTGRLEYGMPSWKGMFSDQQLAELLAFMKTIQK